jgi:hypothetical protein
MGATPAGLYQAVMRRDGHTCCNCNAPATTVHHVVPRSLGGRDHERNMVSLCDECHGLVHGRDMLHHRTLTKAGLAAAKARGVKLGGIRPNTITRNYAARDRAQADSEALRPLLTPMAAQGYSLRQVAEALAAAGTTSRTGKPLSTALVRTHLQRLGLAAS